MDTVNENEVPVKRKRGRPRKHPLPEVQTTPEVQTQTLESPAPVKRGRGRPRKNPLPEIQETQTPDIINRDDNKEPSVTYEQTLVVKKRSRSRKDTDKKIKGYEQDEWASDIMTRTHAKPSYVVKFEGRWYFTQDPEKGFEGDGYDTPVDLIFDFHRSLGFLIMPDDNGNNEVWNMITL